VGSTQTAAGDLLAFLFDDGTMFDLNDLIDPNDPLFGQVVLV
jgi:probable HAF family extracellular repeat protein